VYFIVSLHVYVCDYARASVSGLLKPFLSSVFYPLNLHSFIHLGGFSSFFMLPKNGEDSGKQLFSIFDAVCCLAVPRVVICLT